MAEIIGINTLKGNNIEGELTEEMLKDKMENLTEEDEDMDAQVLDMDDLSNLATAMALIQAGLNKISDIANVEIPGDDAIDLSEVF
jgi:predicted hydrolase (HD superfamily)